jgi:amino acid adenylation domain-containing protein
VPVAPRFLRGRESMPVAVAAARTVREFAKRCGTEIFTPWLAAFGLALSRYAGQRRLTVGVLVPAGMRGFAPHAPARSRLLLDVAPDAAVKALLEQANDALINPQSWSAFEAGISPQLTVSAVALPMVAGATALLESDIEEIEYTLLESELNFFLMAEPGGGLRLDCEYDAELYEPATVSGMLAVWHQLALAFPMSSATALRDLPLWSGEQAKAWLERLRGPVCAIPAMTVNQLVQAQSGRTPDMPAVATADEQLSYRELQLRTDAVAYAIRRRGIAPGARIVVCMERCVDLVAVLLGVMQAGCVYVPLDPDYPASRQIFVFADANAALVISEQTLSGSAPDEEDARRWEQLRVSPGDLLHPAHENVAEDFSVPSASAYLIYTSGSTGRPKGVSVGHRAAVNLLLAMADRSGLQAGQTWLAVTTLAFDISFAELFVPLTVGARVWIASRDQASDPAALAELIDVASATVLQATPATWRMLIAAGWTGKNDLTALSGGEALDSKLARELGGKVGRLCNIYGPTEATVWTTWQDIQDPCTIFIGSPLRNVELRILDDNGMPVPPGVAGELHIGGSGLAEGYHGLAALTQQRFVQHAVCNETPGRFYRTGDLVRASAGGAIRWLARIDDQVKLRGFRIELGEVEAAMNTVPGVRQAVAAIRHVDAYDHRLTGYVVWDSAVPPDWMNTLRNTLRRALPEYMIPTAFIALDVVPLTDNGKVDRKALPAVPAAKQVAPEAAVPGMAFDRLLAIWQEVLQVEAIGPNDNFFDLGGHSMLLVLMQKKVEEAFGLKLPRVDLFRNPTVMGLAAFLERQGANSDDGTRETSRVRAQFRAQAGVGLPDIAVVGIGLRVPGAASPEEFWRNLRHGVESRTEFSEEELLSAGVDPALLANPDYVRAGYVLDDIASFDAAFFGMSPREAEILDPQHRIFLECAAQALEDAGINVESAGRGIGVYAGTNASSYHANLLATREKALGPAAAFQIRISNENDHLPTRVSYRLNLKGPSVNVQTACSTSLVAVHMAAQSLLRGECDTALAGGVCIHVPHRTGYLYQDGMVASPDGHCRSFDRQGAGTVFGSGAGAVVLKRLADALAAGDRIYAVVKGSAINNDGSGKVGYTAPSVDGQAAVIMEAHAMAGVAARDIGYVEAHGTATPLGDPIEVSALTSAFRVTTADTGYCAIGSVKSNIGHLDQAAGIAGFIKTALSLYHGEIPPSLHFTEGNPEIAFDQSPFFVNTRLRPWPLTDGKRIAGVSSFGIGGTNAHVILACAPVVAVAEAQDGGRGVELLTLSARSEAALRAMSGNYAAFLRARPALDLSAVCYTANVGRSAFEQRAAWVVRDRESLVKQLEEFGGGGALPGLRRGVYRNRRPRVAMLFTGQGSQYAGMGGGLYRQEPVFKAALDQCAALLRGELEADLLDVLYGSSTALLDRTDYTQPVLFALGYALRRTWESWGVAPQLVLGHSLGEYLAAQAAGVFSLEDGLRLVARRGQLMQQRCQAGSMLSVALDESGLRQVLAEHGGAVVVAAINGPSQLVVAGGVSEVASLQARLTAQGVRSEILPGSHAFHSPLMAPMLEAYGAALSQVRLSPPRLPVVSNVSAGPGGAEMATAQYWLAHTVSPVAFARSLGCLAREGIDILLEVGPRPTLVALAGQVLAEDGPTMLTSLRAGRDDVEQMLESLAALQVRGTAVDWAGYYGPRKPRKVALPTYPFQRKRYWVEDDKTEAAPMTRSVSSFGLGSRLDVAGADAVFELRCSVATHPFLQHHRLSGKILAPGAFYLGLALQAGKDLSGDVLLGVEDVVLSAPMYFQEQETRMIQLVVTRGSGATRLFAIHSRSEEQAQDQGWTVHARGAFGLPQEPDRLRYVPTDVPAAQVAESMDGQALRAQFAGRGLEYGGSFQALSQIRFENDSAVAKLEAMVAGEKTAAGMLIHPGLLDAALQAAAACRSYQQRSGAFVPLAFQSVIWHQPQQRFKPSSVQVQLDVAETPDTVRANLRIFADDGEPMLDVIGMTLRRLDEAVLAEPVIEPAASEYVVEWAPVDSVDVAVDAAGTWLLVGAAAYLSALGERLQRSGPDVTVIAIDEGADSDTVAALLKDGRSPIRGVLRAMPNPGAESGVSLRDDVAHLCADIIGLATLLAELPLHPQFKLWLLTSGAHMLAGDLKPNVAAQAAISGLGRTIAVEYPDLHCINLDLPHGAPGLQCLDLLWQTLWSADGETDICLRARRYALRMRPAADDDALPVPATSSYRLDTSSDGRLDSLSFVDCQAQGLAAREVEIRVVAAGLNFRDVLRALGKLESPADGVGGECSGIVTAVGAAVAGLGVGDRVMAMADASFASHVTVDQRWVAQMPADWSFEAAATVPVAFLTAHHALSHLGRLTAGQSILIHAAATGVGLAAVQLARRLKLRVFATASAGKRGVLERLGVEHIFDSRSLEFSADVLAATGGQGVHAVLNALTGDFIAASLRVLCQSGVFLEMGKAEIWDTRRVAEHHPTARYMPFDIAQVAAEQIARYLQELLQMFAAAELQPLPRTVYPLRSAPQAFRSMAQGRHVGKLVLRVAGDGPDLSAGASYLVTGAGGALGRRVAEWLAANGARHLILTARRPDGDTDALIERLAANGVHVRLLLADVADKTDMARLFAEIERDWPPLRGLVHAAGMLDDAPLHSLDRERIARVLAPKLDGARLLHQQTRQAALDFYIVYSSIASVLGAAGQGNYAAANGFLDGLVHHRKSLGLPALSINWGAWGGAGMAAAVGPATLWRWRQQGQFLLDPDSGMRSLGRAMCQAYPQVAVIASDWALVGAARRTLPSLLRDLLPQDADTTAMPQAGQAARVVDLHAVIEAAVRKVTGTRAATRLDRQLPLHEIGLDSLMAMELRNELCGNTGLRLSPTMVFDYPTIDAIAGHIAALAGTADPVTSPLPQPAAVATEQLSEEVLRARIEKELAGLEEHLL